MLNLSENTIKYFIDTSTLSSFGKLKKLDQYTYERLLRTALFLLLLVIVSMFLPWTQNVRSNGELIALNPEQRPQTIQSVIAGRIERWYVQEGQRVNKGDTILRISEVKDDYFDPDLMSNTQTQIDAKEYSRTSYIEKAQSLSEQINALEAGRKLKTEQAKNKVQQNILKVQSDSIDLAAARLASDIALEQYKRFETLHAEGLRSLTDLENRRLKWQEAGAKLISQENKFLAAKNELINSRIELNSIEADYLDKISKARSERMSALASQYDSDAAIGKLKSQFNNYSVRRSLYFVLAPQDGFVTQARKTGIGELIKEGDELVSVMPVNYNMAIQMWVKPIDLPLFEKGQEVMVQFDGWPAIIFSGWPGISYGTYRGKVLAMDNFISDNHMYRVLLTPVADEHPWPEQLRVGAGVKAITMLKEVRVWYEIWRQINGFPPDYYKTKSTGQATIKNSKK